MDSTTAVVIIVVIFAIVVLAALWRYRRQGEASIEVGGARVSVKGENDPAKAGAEPATQAASGAFQPAVTIRDAKSGGGIMAEDKTGRGANIERVETEGDILASSENPAAPKA